MEAQGFRSIDAHQHFWRYNDTDYVWMGPEHEALRRDFLPADLKPLLREAGVDATIAVQARQSLEETRWLLELAEIHPWIAGVVGWVDLRSEQLESQLDELADHSRLKGVRHVVHDEPDVNFVRRPDFRRGIGTLAAYGLTYDLLLFPVHLAPATDLVTELPGQQFVIDHIAKPEIRAGKLAPWEADIREIAKRENVCCKLSGMVTEAKLKSWTYDDFVPYLDIVLDAFSPQRCMIGSDWPVCTLSGDYVGVMGIVQRYVSALSPDERAAVLGDTCRRFYGLRRP